MDLGDVFDGIVVLFDFAEHWRTWLKILLVLGGIILIVAGGAGTLGTVPGWVGYVAGGVMIVAAFFWILRDRMDYS